MEKIAWISQISVIIKAMATVYGYKYSSAIIAMAILESNYGRSQLSAKYHNFHGMKCGSSWTGKSVNLATKEEYTPRALTSIRDNFRVYDYEGIKGHFQFLQYTRYNNLKTATSPEDYLRKIVSDGYCTSSTYVKNCMDLINKFSLTDYD